MLIISYVWAPVGYIRLQKLLLYAYIPSLTFKEAAYGCNYLCTGA